MPAPLLMNHVSLTYAHLRRGMAALALVLPWTLWFGGAIVFDVPLQSSLSAYYHTGMRDVFVGVLVALGVFLFLYKGVSARENWGLNIAGMAAPGIAFFPIPPGTDCGGGTGAFSWHMVFASVFFVAIAYVCLFTVDDDPIDLPSGPARERFRQRFRRVAQLCGAIMLLGLAAALGYSLLAPAGLKAQLCGWSIVFWIEVVTVSAFAVYRIGKSMLYDRHISWLPWRLDDSVANLRQFDR